MAAEANVQLRLPALTGSEKQVAWAEQIRAKAITSKANCIPEGMPKPSTLSRHVSDYGLSEEEIKTRFERVQADIRKARQDLQTRTDVKWWIDNRFDIDDLVTRSARQAFQREFADINTRIAAAKQEAERQKHERLEHESQKAREQQSAQEEALRLASEKAAKDIANMDFKVAHVSISHDNITVTGADGTTALGFIDEGDWAVYQVGQIELSSTHAVMERIAQDARTWWMKT